MLNTTTAMPCGRVLRREFGTTPVYSLQVEAQIWWYVASRATVRWVAGLLIIGIKLLEICNWKEKEGFCLRYWHNWIDIIHVILFGQKLKEIIKMPTSPSFFQPTSVCSLLSMEHFIIHTSPRRLKQLRYKDFLLFLFVIPVQRTNPVDFPLSC